MRSSQTLAGAGGGERHLSALRPPRPRPVPEGPRRPSLPAQGYAGEHLACPAVTQTGQTPDASVLIFMKKIISFFF